MARPSWESTGSERSPEFRLDLGPLEIVVHRHIDAPGVWHVSCHRIGLERRALEATDVFEARGEAILVVRDAVGALSAAVGRAV